jgi:5-methylcytosine-specific restriction protein A
VFILQRDIICKICNRAASTCVDHIVPFISPQGVVSWERFKDPLNLQGLCQPCHSRKTATEDGGFGHSVQKVKTLTTAPAPTGTSGKQFSSGSVGNQKLDAAIGTPDELAELLSGIPK